MVQFEIADSPPQAGFKTLSAIGVKSQHSTIAFYQKACEKTNIEHSTSNAQHPDKAKAEIWKAEIISISNIESAVKGMGD